MNDLTGRTFGLWTVLAFGGLRTTPGGWHTPTWLCQCVCGTERTLDAGQLLAKHSRSCGCLYPAHHAHPWMSNANALIRRYRDLARPRGLVYDLAKDHALALFAAPCYYCGAEPAMTMDKVNKRYPFIYNGIDRLDNTQGYVVGNVVACCDPRNHAKGQRSHDEYIAWVLRSADHLRAQPFRVVPLSEWDHLAP